MSSNVSYIWDEKLLENTNRLPAVPGRASLVHNLIEAYNLLQRVKIVRSQPASYNDLKEFHSELYLEYLKSLKDVDNDYLVTEHDEDHGIGYDCPPVSNMYELVASVAGSSVTAVRCLILGWADVVINWCGGWHHANRFGAEGFCYVNDIVIGIEKLRRIYSKVLYIDLDVHHGNGVQDAYNLSKSVFTLSFHKYEAGFYPGTGGIDDIGNMGGRGYSCNFPLHESYSDGTMEYVFEKVFTMVYSYFAPDAVVVQCGADALALDPNGGAGLTHRSYCRCLRLVLDKRKPTMLLGGGGYNHANAARLWASITAMTVGETLDDNIPEHDDWPHYGPNYMLHIEPSLAKDTNKLEYLDDCIAKIHNNLNSYLKSSQEISVTEKTEAHSFKNPRIIFKRNLNGSEMNSSDAQNSKKVKNKESKDVYEFDD